MLATHAAFCKQQVLSQLTSIQFPCKAGWYYSNTPINHNSLSNRPGTNRRFQRSSWTALYRHTINHHLYCSWGVCSSITSLEPDFMSHVPLPCRFHICIFFFLFTKVMHFFLLDNMLDCVPRKHLPTDELECAFILEGIFYF